MKNPPNLFDFATGELSQDAFLCWISEWANSELSEIDEALNSVACHFLAKLCEPALSSATPPPFSAHDIKTVQTHRQHLKTDVLVDIEIKGSEKKHLILIEDKTSSGQHGEQLKKYKAAITKDLKSGDKFKGEREVHYIYYKTHDHITYDLSGFKNIERCDVLRGFETVEAKTIRNQIFLDYAAKLRAAEDASLAYKTKPASEWEYDQWTGFFKEVCKALKKDFETDHPNFGYVPNRAGGFIGAWFGGLETSGLENSERVYFQVNAYPKLKNNGKSLSRYELTLRISSPDKIQTLALKNKIETSILNKFKQSGILYSNKNLRAGKSMRILSILGINIQAGPNSAQAYALELSEMIKTISPIHLT